MEAFSGFLEIMARSHTDYFCVPWIYSDKQAQEIPEFAEKHGVTAYKFYLHCMGGEHIRSMWPLVEALGMYYYDDGTVYLAMKNIASLGPPGLLGLHCENWEIARIIKDELIAQGRSDVAAWDDKSPHFTEAGHVRHYAYYAKATGCPIYIQHTTTPESVEEIMKARAEGVKIFGNTSPHYLTITKDLPRAWRTNVPLRSREAVDKCWEALRAGAIETVSSDNCTTDVRDVSEVEKIGLQYGHNALTWWDGGMGGRSEGFLPVMLSEGVNKGRVSLERLVQVCCENPAKYFGLYPKKGLIAVGSDADLLLVDLEETKTMNRQMLYSWKPWSIWEGWELKGWPVMVIIRGNIMMEWPNSEPRARFIGEPIGQYIPLKPGHTSYPIT
jgi:dihydropyrimidinase/dihydroorotase